MFFAHFQIRRCNSSRKGIEFYLRQQNLPQERKLLHMKENITKKRLATPLDQKIISIEERETRNHLDQMVKKSG